MSLVKLSNLITKKPRGGIAELSNRVTHAAQLGSERCLFTAGSPSGFPGSEQIVELGCRSRGCLRAIQSCGDVYGRCECSAGPGQSVLVVYFRRKDARCKQAVERTFFEDEPRRTGETSMTMFLNCDALRSLRLALRASLVILLSMILLHAI